MKNKVKERIALCIFLIVHCQTLFAQNKIDLQSAIDSALKNNLMLKNEKLNAEYQKRLNATAVDIPQTNVTGEYGQINSIYKDTKFGITQGISFPRVYSKQKALQNEYYKSSVLNLVLKEAELKKQVYEVFYQLVYMQQKQKILLQIDSIYAFFLDKSNLRYAKGESNILEKITAETQRGQIAIQLYQLKNDIEILQLQFQMLLNTTTQYMPLTENPKMNFVTPNDTFAISNHPQLGVLQQQKQISLINTQLAKSKLLPNFYLAYYNMSIQGMGADNVFYTKSTRFSSVQLGLGVPLFYGSQKAKINSSKTLSLISENNYQLGLNKLNSEYQSAYKSYQTQVQTVKYFEDNALQNANTLIKTANKQLVNGDINYLQWTLLINNAAVIQSNYIDAVKELNQSIIQINFLTFK